jgi:NAD+ synthase (glutamine-hydrolysing)
MRIGLGQINATVGDLAGNARRVLEMAREAADSGCHLLVTPELVLTGYPPQDLLFKPHFISDQLAQLHEHLAPALPLPALVGFVDCDAAGKLYNAAAYIANGAVQQVVHKTLLPTYDVFDEWRYFNPAQSTAPVMVGPVPVGVTICEDIWDEGYQRHVVPELAQAGARMIVNLSSSPFHPGKLGERLDVCRRHALAHRLPVLYCNLTGAQDELIFDGESFAMDEDGKITALGPQFQEALICADIAPGAPLPELAVPQRTSAEEMFWALGLGIRDYFHKCGFSRAVIGLSGGIDSAITACLAAEALGPGQVIGVSMPSRFTAEMSMDDARSLAYNLGLEFHVMPIEESVGLAMARFKQEFGAYHSSLTVENLQARERGKILMEISNDLNALVLSTGNKTEYALGYTTLYGDMCGGLAVIGDVSKPEVYELARYYNCWRGAEAIPQRTIERTPTAELRDNQVDPFDYPRIGPLADLVVEEHKSRAELLLAGYTAEEVDRVIRLVRISEYKRIQAPPVLRVSKKAFGIGRRMPVVNKYDG